MPLSTLCKLNSLGLDPLCACICIFLLYMKIELYISTTQPNTTLAYSIPVFIYLTYMSWMVIVWDKLQWAERSMIPTVLLCSWTKFCWSKFNLPVFLTCCPLNLLSSRNSVALIILYLSNILLYCSESWRMTRKYPQN